MTTPACVPPTGEPLVGSAVRLDPMSALDSEGLHAVFADPQCYAHGYLMGTPHRDIEDTRVLVGQYVAQRSATPMRLAYTVRLAGASALGPAGTVVGTSSLGDVDVTREHVHLGWTMYGSRWWGTSVNPETKLLLLSHAFDTCGFGRVRIQTDVRNERSRAAILRLGATFEGVTRRDSRRADGSWRDSAVYSILVEEWPQVRDGLLTRLARPSAVATWTVTRATRPPH